MRSFKKYVLALGMAVAAASISSASATLLQFSIPGETFVLDSDAAPTSYILGQSTTFDVPTDYDHVIVTFYSQASAGGMTILDYHPDIFGVQPSYYSDRYTLKNLPSHNQPVITLYSGSEADPLFVETQVGHPIHFFFNEHEIAGGPGHGSTVGDNPFGGDLTITAIAAVPEPSTWAMLMLGFAGLSFMGFRKKSQPTVLAA